MKKILLVILLVSVLMSNTIYAADNSYIQMTRLVDKQDVTCVSAVVFGNGVFVAAGKPGKVALSKDGISWTVVYCEINDEICKLSFEGNQFFAFTKAGSVFVSTDGTAWDRINMEGMNCSGISYVHDRFFAYGKDIATSSDGKVWTLKHHIENGEINNVLWKNNKFVSIGTFEYTENYYPKTKNICYESKNGEIWLNSSINSESVIDKVTQCDNRFLATGHSYGNLDYIRGFYVMNYQILASQDGINWHKVYDKTFPGFAPMDILSIGSKCVVYDDFRLIKQSDDGASWNDIRLPTDLADFPHGVLAYGNNRFVSLSSYEKYYVASSSDLINWDINRIIPGYHHSLLFCNSKYILSSKCGLTDSKDLLTWQMSSSSKDKIIGFESPILYQNGIYIAVGTYTRIYENDNCTYGTGTPKIIFTSENCEDWKEVYKCDESLSEIIWDGKQFITTTYGENAYILTSEDTKTWKKQVIDTTSWLTDIAYNGKQYIITCNDGSIFISSDCVNWTHKTSFPREIIYGIAAADNNWIIYTSDKGLNVEENSINKIYNSKDGVNWKQVNIPFTNIDKIFYRGGRFLCVTRDISEGGNHVYGKVQISSDGINWSETGDIIGSIYDIVWDGTKYIFICYTKLHYVSTESINIYLGSSINTKPSKTIELIVNDKLMDMDVSPMIMNERMLVPFRAIIEELGGKVDWDNSTGTIRAYKGDNVVELTIDNKNAVVNGKAVELDVPATIQNGRTFVPVRFISESLNAKVTWDSEHNIAIVDMQSSQN